MQHIVDFVGHYAVTFVQDVGDVIARSRFDDRLPAGFAEYGDRKECNYDTQQHAFDETEQRTGLPIEVLDPHSVDCPGHHAKHHPDEERRHEVDGQHRHPAVGAYRADRW